jgi:hypothetical protein
VFSLFGVVEGGRFVELLGWGSVFEEVGSTAAVVDVAGVLGMGADGGALAVSAIVFSGLVGCFVVWADRDGICLF